MRRSLLVAGTILVVVASIFLARELIAERMSLERYRPLLERKLSEAIGLRVEIRGDLRLDVLPLPHVEAADILLASTSADLPEPFFTIGTANLTLGWRGLFFGTPRIRELAVMDAELQIERPPAEVPTLPAHLELLDEDRPGDEIELQIRRVRFENLDVFYRGQSGTFTHTHFRLLSVASAAGGGPLEVAARGDFEGGSFDVRGELGSLAELLRPTRPYPVALAGRVLDAQVSVDGSIAEPRGLRGLDLALSATLPDLSELAPRATPPPPRTGPVTLRGRLRDSDRTLGLEQLVVSTGREAPLRVELRGAVKDLVAFRGVELDLRLDADDASFLEPFLEWPVPNMGSVHALVRIEDSDGSLGLEGELHAGREDALRIDLTGSYDDLRAATGVEFALRVWARDLREIGQALELERALPALGPVTASGTLRKREADLGIDGIAIELGNREDTWAVVNGSIRDLAGLQGVQLTAEFGAVDLRHASPYLRGEPPDIGPLRGVARLADSDGTLGIEDFSLQGGREGLFELDLSGRFDDLREIDELEVEVRLAARDLGVLGQVFGAELPAVGPLELSGQLRGTEGRIVAEGQARVDETRFHGELVVELADGARPHVWARLETPHLHLDDIGLAPQYAAALPAPSESNAIPLEALRSLDADVFLQAERVTGRLGLDLHDVKTEIHLFDGRFVIRDLEASSDGGLVRADLEIDGRTAYPELALRAEVESMDLTRLAAQLQEESEAAGLMFLSADLRGRGRTLDEIRSSLSGRFEVMMRDGVLASQYARRFARSFVSVSIPSLRVPADAPIGCLRVELDIAEGVASVQKLLLQAPNVIVDGQGEIDIGRNAIALRLTPKARDPGLVSIAVAVDVSGRINDPTYSAVRRTIATSLAEGVIRSALRPANRLLQPFRAPAEAGDPCVEPLHAVYAGPGDGELAGPPEPGGGAQ